MPRPKKKSPKRTNGSGSISFIRGKWVARISVWTSEGRSRPSKSFDTKAEAEEWIRTMLAMIESGSIDFDAEKITVGEYVMRWLEDTAKPTIAPATYTRYEQAVRLRITPPLGTIPLKKLTPAHVRSWVKDIAQTLRPATVRHSLTVLRIAVNQAVEDGILSKNPTRRTKPPKEPNDEMCCLTEEEATRLMQVVRGTSYEAYYLLALKLGLRQGELGGLFWPDIDFEKKTLTVSRSVYVARGKEVWGSTKTGEERQIVLSPGLIETLKRHSKLQKAEKLASPYPWRDSRLIFPSETGGVKTRSTIYRRFMGHLEAAGLRRVRFQDLRDTAASLALGQGVPVHVVAQMLGHADPAMTLRRYSHVLPSMTEMAAARMDSLSF